MVENELDDNSLMPYGKYKGIKMANVPFSYLFYLLDNKKCCGKVKKYIEESMDALEKELTEYVKKRQKNDY